MIFNAYTEQQNTVGGFSVKSSGHIFAKPGREINRPQGREDWLLFYVAKGSETFYLPQKVTAQAGSFILFRPHERQHHICTAERTSEFYYVHFNAPADFEPPFETSVVYAAEPRRAVVMLYEALIEEILQKLPCYEKLCVYKLHELLTVLERSLIHDTHPLGDYFDKIAFIVQQMNKDYQNPRSLEEYAAECGISKYHFLRVFEQVTGSTPIEYQNRIRIERAKLLLEESNTPISEIAARLGYTSPAYFSDAFKKKTGLSPSQYRRRI